MKVPAVKMHSHTCFVHRTIHLLPCNVKLQVLQKLAACNMSAQKRHSPSASQSSATKADVHLKRPTLKGLINPRIIGQSVSERQEQTRAIAPRQTHASGDHPNMIKSCMSSRERRQSCPPLTSQTS